MRRMWQKYTPGKRVLALLLAVLMLCDTFTVSASTTEGEIITEVESEVVEETGDVTEPEEGLVEETIEEEPVVTDEPEIENLEEEEPILEGEIIEGEVELLTSGSFSLEALSSVSLRGSDNHLKTNQVVRVYGDIYSMTDEYVWLGSSELISENDFIVTLADDKGEVISGTYAGSMSGYDNEGNPYYEIGFGFEFGDKPGYLPNTVIVKNAYDETEVYTYYFEYENVYQTDARGNAYAMGTYYSYEVGDTFKLSSLCPEDGVFGYIAVVSTDNAVRVSVDDMTATQKATWNNVYKSKYGAYGSGGKYYFFKQGDEIWYPSFEVVSTAAAYINCYLKDGDSFKQFTGTSIYATDYHLEYNGGRLYSDSKGKINYIKYGTEDLIFDVYNGNKLYTGPVQASYYGNQPGEGVTVHTYENGGKYICIDAELLKSYETIGFSVYYDDLGESQIYTILPYGMQINYHNDNSNESCWIADGETLELKLNDNVSVAIEEYVRLDHEGISNVTLTSSNESVLALHGEAGIYTYGDSSFSLKSTFLELKKVGTSKLTASFEYEGVTYTKSINVKVVLGAETPGFGYYNADREFTPFENGKTYDLELGTHYEIFTTVSPRALSGISVKSANSSLASVYGNISEQYIYTEESEYNWAHYSTNCAYLDTGMYQTGTVKLTMSAVYAGKTYTQTVTLNIIEPKGLQFKFVNSGNSDQFYVQSNRASEIYVNTGGQVRLYALFDDNAEGVTAPADAADYTFEVLEWVQTGESYGNGEYVVSDDFRIVFKNDYIFYVLPLSDDLSTYREDYLVRVTANVPEGEEANSIDVPLYMNPSNLFYLNCDETTGEVSNPVSEIQFVEGEDTVFYTKLRADYGENYQFSYSNGLVMKESTVVYRHEAEYEYDSWIIVKFVVQNDGSCTYDWQMTTNINAVDRNWYVGEFYYRLLKSAECDAPVATQAQISDFLNAEDASCDISAENAVRYMDYVVSLKTGENGEKSAIIVGYVGNKVQVSMPDKLDALVILDNGTNAVHSMSDYATIPVIGLEDGVFDTAKGYTQPERVHLYEGYTYLGTNYTGWVNVNSGKRTSYDWWSYEGMHEPTGFRIINNMVFTTANEQLVCVDTGNAGFAAVVPEGVVLYKNRTSGRTKIDLVKSNAVSYYNLAESYLYTVEATGAAIEVPIKVEAENGQYYVSIDNTHENAAMLEDLTSGVYYMDLVPVITIEGQEIILAAQKCELVITFDEAVPEVKITNSNVTVNTYLGNTCLVFFDVTNSFGTRVDSIAFVDANKAVTEAGLVIGQNGDGNCLLAWNGEKIPKNNKITLEVAFGVAGYGEDGVVDSEIKTQTITVNFKSIVPKATLEKTALTINEYPYSMQSVKLDVKDGRAYGRIDAEATKIEVISAPKGGNASDIAVTIEPKNSFSGWVDVDVHNNAVPGAYKVKITPALAPVRGEEERYFASAVTLTVNVKGAKPTIKFADKLNVTLNSNFYNVTETLPGLVYATTASGQVSQGVMHNPTNNVGVEVITKSAPKNADTSLVKLTAYFDGLEAVEAEEKVYCLETISFVASAASGATAGNYVFDIKVPVMVDADVVWVATTATVKVVNTLPTFKLTETSVSLDASRPMVATTRLIMDAGYELVDVDVIAPNVNAEMCVEVDAKSNGEITFEVWNIGLTAGGTYKVTPIVRTARGEEITLKTMNIALKVTNSSKATLSAKIKSITVNPYLNGYAIDPVFTTKGVTLQGETGYYFVPTNALARDAEFEIGWSEEGYMYVIGCDPTEIDGKYTYNVVGVTETEDGAYEITKSIPFTVQVAKKNLTVVPSKSSVTVYKNFCNGFTLGEGDEAVEYLIAEVPVSIKETPDANILLELEEEDNATNSMANKGVVTYFAEGTNSAASLYIVFPASMPKLSNLTVTPVVKDGIQKAFNNFKVSVNVNASDPSKVSTTFASGKVTLDRLTTNAASNTLMDTEGFLISGYTVTSVMKGKEDCTGKFVFAGEGKEITAIIADDYIDTIANGTYTVTVEPEVVFAIGTEEDDVATATLKPCSYTINVTQAKATLLVSENIVNLYPEVKGATEAAITVSANVSGKDIPIAKTEVAKSSGKMEIGTFVYGTNISIGTNATKAGANKYNVTVYAKNFGSESEDALVSLGTLRNAFTVNIKTLPAKIALTNAKPTFNPYLEKSVETSINSAELLALMEPGNEADRYQVTVEERTSKYGVLEENKKNDVLAIATDEKGTIAITANKLPEKKATYYYTATVDLILGNRTVKSYSVNFPVTVNPVMPKAELYQTTVTLNNAYLNVEAGTFLKMSTGGTMWQFTEVDDENAVWDITVLSGKKDVSEYFEIERTDNNALSVRLVSELNGKTFSVPKGNYTLTVTPKVINENADVETLAPLKLTIKVVSNKPTVKYAATKLTVNTYTNVVQQTKLTLSNGGTFVPGMSTIECTKYPNKNITSAEGIAVTLAADGTLSAVAGRNAQAGTYTYTVTPVTSIDGRYVALDAKTVSVVVQNTMPTAVLSSSKVTVNSLFADDYYATIDVTAKNAGKYQYVFYTDAIKFADTKSTKQTVRDNAAILLDNMEVELYENGKATIVVMLPEDKTVANGTYKFTLTPSILTGDESQPSYDLKPVSFSVVVENKKPTLSAKVVGSIDLVNMNKNKAEIQLSFNKQNYETVANIDDIRIYDKSTGEYAWQFMIDYVDWANGKIVLTNSERLPAGKSYALQVEVTSTTGQVYLANCAVKTAQAGYKITAGTANFYTAINSGSVQLSATDGVSLNNVEVLKVTTDKAGRSVIKNVEFDGRLGNNNTVEIWSNGNLPSNIKKGSTIYVQLEVTPYGLATNKQPTKITVPVTVK